MRIEVVVTEWEQACCGAAFAVDREVSFNVFAADPASISSGNPPRFFEEHHDDTSEDLPSRVVTGKVREIDGVVYARVPVIGEVGSFSLDWEHPVATPVQAVGAAESSQFSEYHVLMDVADDVELPTFAATSAIDEREAAATAYRRNHVRRNDEVGVVLEEAAAYALFTYGTVADIARDSNRSAMTAKPHRDGAAAVRWARSAGEDDEDTINLIVGRGQWGLPADVDHAALARLFLDAAALGDVSEEVVELGDGGTRIDTHVVSRDGRSWQASRTNPAVDIGQNVVLLAGEDWDLERGYHVYKAWKSDMTDGEEKPSARLL